MSAICLAAALAAGCDTVRDEPGRWSPEKLYAEAKEEASIGNWEKAAQYYERLEGRAAGSVLAQQAQIERAYALWKSGEKAQALSSIERFIKLHPTSPALDYAYYLQGLINFNDNLGILGSLISQDLSERDQQASRDAYQAFRQLTEQFPQSPYSEDARLRMGYIVNALANYEVHVARYYYRRGAYVARRQPGPADGAGVPAVAGRRRGALHHGPQLRQARPAAAARRHHPGAQEELPADADRGQRPRQQAVVVVAALVGTASRA